MNLILDINHQKVHKESCKILREQVKPEHQKKISNESEIPKHYAKCKECNPKKNYDDTKWGSLV